MSKETILDILDVYLQGGYIFLKIINVCSKLALWKRDPGSHPRLSKNPGSACIYLLGFVFSLSSLYISYVA